MSANIIEAMLKSLNASGGVPSELVEVEKVGTKLILPAGWDFRKGRDYCHRKMEEEEEVVPYPKEYDGFTAEDLCWAVTQVLEELFGGAQASRGFFKQMNQMSIVIDKIDGVEKTVTGVYGDIDIPAWENARMQVDPRHRKVTIAAARKYEGLVRQFHERVWCRLREKSIYFGKMVEVSKTREWGLTFRITEHKVNPNICLNPREDRMVNRLIIDRLDSVDSEPWIFCGGYGNGKSETALRIGIEAAKKGHIFFYVKDPNLLSMLITSIDKCYQPATFLVEDMDKMSADQVKSIMDGSETKNARLTAMFTTNFPEKLDPACRRPERGGFLEFVNPIGPTREKICRSLTEDTVVDFPTEEFSGFWRDFPDTCGAVVATTVKRAKALVDPGMAMTMEHLQLGLDLMLPQIRFMEEDQVEEADTLTEVFSTLISEAVEQTVKEEVVDKMDSEHSDLDSNISGVEYKVDAVQEFLSDEVQCDTQAIRDHLDC